MSSISGISGVSSYSSSLYGSIASGRSLQSAADGAAELTMVEEENAQITGYEVGNQNISSAKSVLNISDSALSSVNDYLQEIRDLALAASNNALYTESDIASMQKQVEQYKQGIADIASNTQYNTISLLDGTNQNFSIATDANGTTSTVSTANATLEALGIADFDLTGSYSLDTIDQAMEMVNGARASIGAQSNALDFQSSYNSNAYEQLNRAVSKKEDTDYPQAVEKLKKQQALQAYSLMMQKKKQQQEAQAVQNFFTR